MERLSLILAGRVGDRDVRFELAEGLHVLGRATDCDVVLAESSISRRHTELEYAGGRVRVRDLGSHNGTHVNGVAAEGWYNVGPGDQLTLGRAVFTVGGAMESQALMTIVGDHHSTGVAITWQEVTGSDGAASRMALLTWAEATGVRIVAPWST